MVVIGALLGDADVPVGGFGHGAIGELGDRCDPWPAVAPGLVIAAALAIVGISALVIPAGDLEGPASFRVSVSFALLVVVLGSFLAFGLLGALLLSR